MSTAAPDKILSLLRPWTWIHRVPQVALSEAVEIAAVTWQNRRILWATTFVEFQRRYAGNILGWLWAPLYSLLFLAMYGFVFVFVFGASHLEFTQYEYMVYIFCGLVPYFGFADALNNSTYLLGSADQTDSAIDDVLVEDVKRRKGEIQRANSPDFDPNA